MSSPDFRWTVSTNSLCAVAATGLVVSLANSCSLLAGMDMSGVVATVQSLSHGLLMGAVVPPAPYTSLLPQLGSFHAVLVAMTCTSLPLLALDIVASEGPKKRVPAHVVMLIGMRLCVVYACSFMYAHYLDIVHTHHTASISSALLGSLLLGTTVAFTIARLVQIAHIAQQQQQPPSPLPFDDADFAAMLSRIPTITHTLAATEEHEPLLVEPRSTSTVCVGSLVVVQPGGVVPLDGTVVWGSAPVEYAALDKRTRRVACAKGSKVLAGSVVRDTVLVVQVTRAQRENTAGYVVVGHYVGGEVRGGEVRPQAFI